ncbi:O-antigen ligase family protein [Nitratidesulfovibrio sp.]|uniref:O-antigen ligase family protein n=1 Tax=Nitratidesulfovibrio sp. TaxID=2802297 RepID=UPI003341139D
MTDIRHRITTAAATFRSASAPQKAEWARTALFWLFWLSIVTFPLGQAFRETGPILSLAALLAYHYWGYRQSTLRRFPLKWLFVVFYGLICVKTALSLDPRQSLVYVLPNVWKGFALPFVAMECARDMRDMRRLVWAFAIVCVYEGLDGIYQQLTGQDLINGTAVIFGRLTGSMSTYRVGDYMALVLIPALGLWAMQPQTRSAWRRAAVTALILAPGVHLLIFAQARSGYLGVAAALFLLWYLFTRPKPVYLLVPAGIGILAMLFGPQRITLETAMRDGRIELWRMAWEVIQARPLTGWGMGMFGPAFKALELQPVINSPHIQHPHSVYIQFLVDTGAVGFAIAMTFLLGMLAWGLRRVHRNVPRSGAPYDMWTMAAFFLAGWLCYLVEALFAHDFLRTWWMAVSMGHLGVMIGTVINAETNTDTSLASPVETSIHETRNNS